MAVDIYKPVIFQMSRGEQIQSNSSLASKVLLVCLGLGLMVLFEFILRVCGAFPIQKSSDPFLGFEGMRPLFVQARVDGQKVYVTNPQKLEFFNNQMFSAAKDPNDFRVFCFGGSTTYGRPYRAETAFPAWLNVLLNAVEPNRTHQVINVGGISYASYRIVPLMREMINYEPDCFIVYTGHNEFLETVTYSAILDRPEILKQVISTLDKTRIYRLLRSTISSAKRVAKPKTTGMPTEVEANLDRIGGFELYRRDMLQHQNIIAQFRRNINRMIDMSRETEVPIMFVQPVSNTSDFSPFKSVPTDGIDARQEMKAQSLRENADDLLQRKNFAEARRLLDSALDLDPQFAAGHFLQGQCLERLGLIDKAREEYQQAIDLDVCPLRAISRIEKSVQEIVRARRCAVVRLDSLFALECENGLLGKELFVDHVHPTTGGHQLIAERILAQMRDLDLVHETRPLDAASRGEIFRRHLATLDSDYYAYGDLNLAKVLSWSRKHAEALVPLEAAVSALPKNLEALRLLADTYARLGMNDKALASYHRLLSLEPSDAQSWDNLCDLELKLGDFAAALNAGRKAITIAPTQGRFYATLARAYVKSGDATAALKYFGRALELDSTDAAVWNNLGKVYYSDKKYERAISCFKQAIQKNPQYSLAYSNLGRCYHTVGDYRRAALVYQRAIEITPLDVELHNALGIVRLRAKNFDGAIAEFKQLLQIDSSYASAYQNLGIAYSFSGKPDSSAMYFERALYFCSLADQEQRAEVLSGLGNATAMSGDLARAVEAWEQCLTISPKNTKVLFNLALAFKQLRKPRKALLCLQRLNKLQPEDPRITTAMGDVLVELGRDDEAQVHFEKAKSLVATR